MVDKLVMGRYYRLTPNSDSHDKLKHVVFTPVILDNGRVMLSPANDGVLQTMLYDDSWYICKDEDGNTIIPFGFAMGEIREVSEDEV